MRTSTHWTEGVTVVPRSKISPSENHPFLTRQLRRLGALTATVGFVGLALVSMAGTASAAPCGTVKDVTVKNRGFKVGEAHYTIDCSAGFVLVTGSVVDTKADGHCVESKVVAGGAVQKFRACGKGRSATIDYKVIGNSAVVYTYRV